MIVVIQCAARKREDAGFLRTRDGEPVLFVADPTSTPASESCVYARPDDPSGHGGTWRDVLVRYNEMPANNPFSLARHRTRPLAPVSRCRAESIFPRWRSIQITEAIETGLG